MIEKDLVQSVVSAETSALSGGGRNRVYSETNANINKLLVWLSVTPDFFITYDDEKKFDDLIIEPISIAGQDRGGY